MTQRYILLYDKQTGLKKMPQREWKKIVLAAPEHMRQRLSFMTAEHHAVRYFAVRQLPLNQGKPLSPRDIANACSLPVARVKAILEELEKNLFFLVRDRKGNVVWAYPVTVDETPHALTFNHGERLFGA